METLLDLLRRMFDLFGAAFRYVELWLPLFALRFLIRFGRRKAKSEVPPVRVCVDAAPIHVERRGEGTRGGPLGPFADYAGASYTEFRALWPRRVPLHEWSTMLIYLYSGMNGRRRAEADFLRRTGAAAHDHDSSTASSRLTYGAEVTIVPEIDGVAFNPPSARVLWLEDCQSVEFRMKITKESRVRGRVGFYVGPLLIADLGVWLRPIGSPAPETLESFAAATPYRTIFVSYSHQDSTIVEQLERAYTALGDSYLRDVKILRSGETWSEALLAQIPAADVFQLCWSSAAKESIYVEREWRCALALDRQHFIRPMYWQQPMPPAPAELEHLHFAYLAAV
jgi:hypothetical protein